MSTINSITSSPASHLSQASGTEARPEENIFRKTLEEKSPERKDLKKERKFSPKKEGRGEDDFLLGCCLGVCLAAFAASGSAYREPCHYRRRGWGYRPIYREPVFVCGPRRYW